MHILLIKFTLYILFRSNSTNYSLMYIYSRWLRITGECGYWCVQNHQAFPARYLFPMIKIWRWMCVMRSKSSRNYSLLGIYSRWLKINGDSGYAFKIMTQLFPMIEKGFIPNVIGICVLFPHKCGCISNKGRIVSAMTRNE